MSEDKKDAQEETPHGHRDRGVRDEPSHTGGGKKQPHDPEAVRYEKEKTFKPDRDGSEL